MASDTFEKALDDFLQTTEYDRAEDAIYTIVRKAFSADWRAAVETNDAQKVISLSAKWQHS